MQGHQPEAMMDPVRPWLWPDLVIAGCRNNGGEEGRRREEMSARFSITKGGEAGEAGSSFCPASIVPRTRSEKPHLQRCGKHPRPGALSLSLEFVMPFLTRSPSPGTEHRGTFPERARYRKRGAVCEQGVRRVAEDPVEERPDV